MALTRWVWITEKNGAYVLAFTYFDSQAGPSAKGGVVTDAPLSWTNAIERPDRTFRDPTVFGAVPLTEEEAKRRGLPDEPPWLSIYTEGIARVAAAPDGLRIHGRVVLDSAPASFGIEVQLGMRVGLDFIPVDKCAPAADGTFSLAKPASGEHFLVARGPSLGSAYVLATDGAPITLEVFRGAVLQGHVQKNGKGVRAQIKAEPRGHAAPLRITRAEADGSFHLPGLSPGRYTVEVMGVDAGNMINGMPAMDDLVVASGEIVERGYVLMGGATISVTVQTNDKTNSDNAGVYLIVGTLAPRNRGDVRPLFRTSALRSANSASRKGGIVTTQFLDVVAGTYTLCSIRDQFGKTTDETPMVYVHLTVSGADLDVQLELPG